MDFENNKNNELQSHTLHRSTSSETLVKKKHNSPYMLLLNSQMNSNFYVVDVGRKVVRKVHSNEFKQAKGPTVVMKNNKFKLKCGSRKEFYEFYSLYSKKFESESLLSMITGTYNGCKTLLSITSSVINGNVDINLQSLLLDSTSLLLQHSSGTFNNWTPSYLIGFLARVYSILMRTQSVCRTYSAESLDSLLILGASIGLPDSFFNVLKKMSLLTNKKVGDHPGLFLELVQSVSNYFLVVMEKLDWLPTKAKEFLRKLFGFGAMQKVSFDVKRTISEWQSDKRVMLQADFRERVKLLKKEIDANPDTTEKLRTMMNFKQDYVILERMVIGANSYEKCSRQEPVCIILEGSPGVFKTVAMLYIIKLLNRSYYTHIVKSTDDGKDHYDGYSNEDIFVMDDVGQQGISQWRTVINMVSSVKMPLECAAVDLKDTKYFDSKFLIITTNQFSSLHGLTKTDGISDLKALFRRAHVFNFESKNHVVYKRFCIYQDTWVNQFLHPTQIRNTCDGNTYDIAIWITALAEQMEDYYSKISGNIELTPSQVELGREKIEELKESYMEFESFAALSCGVSQIVNTMSSALVDMLNFVTEFISAHLTSHVCVAVGLVGYSIYTYLSGYLQSSTEFDSHSSVLAEWRSAIKAKNKVVSLVGGVPIISEGTANTLIETVNKQVKIVKIIKEDGNMEITHCLVSGTNILLPAHTIFKTRKTLILYNSQEDFVLENRALDNCKFKILFEDRINDVAILQVPLLNNTPYKNLSHLFKHVDKVANNVYFVWSGDPVKLNGNVRPLENATAYTTAFGSVHPDVVLTYEMTSKGFCGSLVVDSVQGILGFHVAGDQQSLGMAKIFSQSLKSKISKYLMDGFSGELDVLPVSGENFSGMVTASKQISDGPEKSHFKPSKFYNLFPITKKPAELRALGPHTVKERAKRMHKIVKTIDSAELKFMGKFLDFILPNFCSIAEYEVIKGKEGLSPLNKDSVSGMDFPKDKRDYFDFEKGVTKEPFTQELDKYRLEALQGYPTKITQHHTLKDELRLLHKVQKPRTFGVDSLTTQFEMKRLMGDLFVKLRERKWENGLAIGINPYMDWGKLYDTLSKCDATWDGDIGEWDASVSPEIQYLINEKIIGKFVGSYEDKIELERVLDLSVQSWVIAGNKKMYKTHGILSGMWITNLFNSLINRCYTAGWYYRQFLLMKNEEPTVLKFLTDVVDFVQGDDKIVGVRGNYHNLTAQTMRDYYESCGMTFTDGKKGKIDYDSKPLSECVFLKRSFLFHNELNKLMGPIDEETITNTLMWYKDDNEESEIMKDKVIVFQREAYLMEPRKREKLMTELINYMIKNNLEYSLLSEEYLKAAYLEDANALYEHTKRTSGKYY